MTMTDAERGAIADGALALLTASPDWMEDCMRWRGRILTGRRPHWCGEWDELPVDDTCPEWPCSCVSDETVGEAL